MKMISGKFYVGFAHAISLAFALSLLCGAANAATIGPISIFASGIGVNATGPDSITIGSGSVWVAYTNGLNGDGTIPNTTTIGNSTVVQYDRSGNALHQYSIAGSVDGLKIDPSTGLVWALQNQDANSSLTLIDPVAQTLTPFTYATTSTAHGFDDIVFKGSQIFLSYTNPAANSDSTVVLLANRVSPLQVTPILTFGASTATQNDPDSLKLTQTGGLALTSGDDGAINLISNPGTGSQALSTLVLNDLNGDPFSGLDDTLFPTTSQGRIYLTDTGNNRIITLQASGLATNSIYAAVGNSTVNALGGVDPVTGAFTPVVSGLNRPHGLAFEAAPEPGSVFTMLAGFLLLIGYARRRTSNLLPKLYL